MEGKYDKKQGIDGIATLTNDPIAMDNIRRNICKGSRAMCYGNRKRGTVLEVDVSGNVCKALFDDTEETRIECRQLPII